MQEGLAKLGDLADERREVIQPHPLGDELARGPCEDRMFDNCLVREGRPSSLATDPPAQPDVLGQWLADPRTEPVLESAGALEGVAGDEQVRRLVEPVLVPDPDRAIEGCSDRACDRAHRSLHEIGVLECGETGAKPIGSRNAIGVGEGQQRCRRCGDPGIARRAGPLGLRSAHEAHRPAGPLGDRRGRIAGAVVDDDHLVGRLEVLAGERRERGADRRRRVAGGDDDADGRPGGPVTGRGHLAQLPAARGVGARSRRR